VGGEESDLALIWRENESCGGLNEEHQTYSPKLAAGRIPGAATSRENRPQSPETYRRRHVGSVSRITHFLSERTRSEVGRGR
jgi:hypothetical protein